MRFISSIFSPTILYNGAQLGVNAAVHYVHRSADQLKFVSPRGYESVIVYAAKRTMMQLAFAKINDLYPAYIRQIEEKRITHAVQKQQKNKQQIITGGQTIDQNLFGRKQVSISYMGKPAPEALLIWIPNQQNTSNDITINTYWDKIKNLSNDDAARSSTITNTVIKVPADPKNVFWDLGPMVQAQSSNNVVLTKVQGRNYSRKELISGGDINFTVTGKIVSNYPDVYPYEQVSKFIALMQYPGILQVSNLMFTQFNVTQIIIKDFQMGQNEGFKNVQAYSFSCVGVEPDKAVAAVEDTINATNLNIQTSKKKGWTTKLLEQVKAAAANQAAQMIEQLTAKTI